MNVSLLSFLCRVDALVEGRDHGLCPRLQALHESHGVVFHLGQVARAIGERAVPDPG